MWRRLAEMLGLHHAVDIADDRASKAKRLDTLADETTAVGVRIEDIAQRIRIESRLAADYRAAEARRTRS